LKSINHIHIPRCSGIYIKSHIVNDLKAKRIPYFATNHGEVFPETFKDKKFISGHFGLTPLKYRDDLINICLVRDPVDRFISNFIYMHRSYKGLHLDAQLEQWMENKDQYNLQAKSLNKSLDESLYNSMNHGTERALNGWCLEGGPINMLEVKNLIDSMEIVNTIDNHKNFIDDLNNLLYQTFGFYSFSNRNQMNENFSIMTISKDMRKKIEDLNSLDMEVYDYVKSKN
jgi:hypothetical protein